MRSLVAGTIGLLVLVLAVLPLQAADYAPSLMYHSVLNGLKLNPSTGNFQLDSMWAVFLPEAERTPGSLHPYSPDDGRNLWATLSEAGGQEIGRYDFWVEDKEHPAYHPIQTTTGTYSPLDPIMLWSDILSAGMNPENVRLLGIGGGALSAFEYRLAVLLRARVGVLPAAGRAALDIALDPDWSGAKSSTATPSAAGEGNEAAGADLDKPCLLRLPSDLESVRVFIQPPGPSGMIDPEKREQMAEVGMQLDMEVHLRKITERTAGQYFSVEAKPGTGIEEFERQLSKSIRVVAPTNTRERLLSLL